MRIILTENDIKKALIAYTSTLGLNLTNHHVVIELTAGRGANGHSATVIIDEADETKDPVNVSPAPVIPQAVFQPQAQGKVVDEGKAFAAEIAIPVVTEETEGHESSEKKSLFS